MFVAVNHVNAAPARPTGHLPCVPKGRNWPGPIRPGHEVYQVGDGFAGEPAGERALALGDDVTPQVVAPPEEEPALEDPRRATEVGIIRQVENSHHRPPRTRASTGPRRGLPQNETRTQSTSGRALGRQPNGRKVLREFGFHVGPALPRANLFRPTGHSLHPVLKPRPALLAED